MRGRIKNLSGIYSTLVGHSHSSAIRLTSSAPLYDATGRLAFFLGGQIDVSTAVHSTSDVLRILSFNADEEEEQPAVQSPAKTSRNSFFDTFRKSKPAPVRPPGMENALVEDLQNLNVRQQKEAFYSAYSKYFIVNIETMLICFHSSGIKDMLYSSKSPTHGTVIGQDIFKFLAQHTFNGLPRDYKSRVKSSIKSGTAVSLDLALSTRRIMGSEQFATHWTPLKNDVNQVVFAVVTLGSLQDVRR